MGFPQWKVLMEAHLQAKGLDVWRVTNEGKRNKNKSEKQHDAIAKSTLLSSLCDSVFNRVFNSPNAHELWKLIVENEEGTKDVANQKYHILGDKFANFKQLESKDAHDMYSRLNILVNEINGLGVKNVEDGDINWKILQVLRKPDYDIIKTLLLKEDLENKKPNELINQIIAHEYSMGMSKPQGGASSSSPTSLTAKHTCKLHQPRRQEESSSDEHEEEESDDEESSSEDEQVSRAIRYHHDKVAKHVRKLYKLGYETRIRRDEVGVFKMASKKKKSKTKKHLACSAIHKLSPPPMCLMAKDKEHDELKKLNEEPKLKFENLQSSSDASIPCDILCAIPIVKVDVSTSCDLISCKENVVEILDEKFEQENEMLKQEVERLMEDLRRLKGKVHMEQSQPSQNNPAKGVNKLEKGSIVICFKCHKEGHKSYQCKEEKAQQKSSNKGNNKGKGDKKAKEEQKKSPHLKALLGDFDAKGGENVTKQAKGDNKTNTLLPSWSKESIVDKGGELWPKEERKREEKK
ncbi:histone-lysine N-methyltransferase, H3 lysine-4 specific-like [Panicum virgatum]|uniref:histone-lysine N-methyltransferase, H3 lysine-4 specific-like n=1 Tax=Panicum virgatum TaxID=38727 RepID=UPI0019D5C901|nr:histone-lysine N-methyltransferase, H3 lysine-4 specific-like [Panicum virgatum]